MSKYVYVIHADGSDFYKIGMSSTPRTRLGLLQYSSPHELHLVATSKDVGFIVARDTERFLHRLYQENRYRKEWFEFKSQKDVNDIKEYVEALE